MTVLSADDRVALRDLVARYAMHADRRDLDALSELFEPEASLVLPDPPTELGPVHTHTGRDAIVQALSSLHTIPVTTHELVGEVFDGEGDTATGHIACVAHHITEKGDLVWHLHYTDAYTRRENTWRLTHRALQIDWIETRPVRKVRP